MRLATRMLLFKADVATRRAARERRRRLEHDIACFATTAERQDLLATLERYPDNATREVREILDRQVTRERFQRHMRFR
jgi:hypothetical protein